MLRDPRVVATVNFQDKYGRAALHHACNDENERATTTIACVVQLLQDPRVRATINLQDEDGNTALHNACTSEEDKEKMPAMVHYLLQAGTNPYLINKGGLTPLAVLQQQWPSYRGAIALLLQAPDTQKASILVKARRLFVVSASNTAPSYLQGRVVQRQPLPRVMLSRMPLPRKVKAGHDQDGEESSKLRLAGFCPWDGRRTGGPRHAARRVPGSDGPIHARLGPTASRYRRRRRGGPVR